MALETTFVPYFVQTPQPLDWINSLFAPRALARTHLSPSSIGSLTSLDN